MIFISNNKEILDDFVKYCKQHPDKRFWQALRDWSGYNYILVTNSTRWMIDSFIQNTFYWEGKKK